MSAREPEMIQLNLPASYTYLHILSDCITTLLTNVDTINDRELLIYNVQLAAHEVCTNIVNHAYDGTHQGRIAVTLTLSYQPNQISIEFQDNGRTFDAGSVPDPNLNEPQVHGYGLFLIRNLMDSVTYTPQEGCNRWQLVKHL